jgi:hypothetical protein
VQANLGLAEYLKEIPEAEYLKEIPEEGACV